MSEMIERVAKAIHDAMDITDGLDGTAAERYARAAIEAMRQPTSQMQRAGWVKLREKNDIQTRLGNSLVGVETPVYEAMIDAALS